jgi:hypothetical protein
VGHKGVGRRTRGPEVVGGLGGWCGAVGHGGCAGVVSGLRGQGVYRSGSAVGVLEMSEVVRMVGGGWVRFRYV